MLKLFFIYIFYFLLLFSLYIWIEIVFVINFVKRKTYFEHILYIIIYNIHVYTKNFLPGV